MSGPYFQGQQPSPCGHCYPDVLRIRDEITRLNRPRRLLNCIYCGDYWVILPFCAVDNDETDRGQLAAIRSRERARLIR